MEGTYRGMMIAIPAIHWQFFSQMTISEFSNTLTICQSVRLERFSSSIPGPKNPSQNQRIPAHPHVSTAKLLAEAKRKTPRKSLWTAARAGLT